MDQSSNFNDELHLSKKILEKHTINCNDILFKELEDKIIHYIDLKAKKIYMWKGIDNKYLENKYHFWGDLQIELLESLPKDRLSIKSKDVLNLLYRKFPRKSRLYHRDRGGLYSVVSPIKDKIFSDATWIKILNNKNIDRGRNRTWSESKGVMVESSLSEFSQDFNKVVSLDPVRFINLVLKLKKDIPSKFIDTLFNGVAYSEVLSNVPTHLIEEIIFKYNYENNSSRMQNICEIINRKENLEVTENLIEIINNIVFSHKEDSVYERGKSFKDIEIGTLNSDRGRVGMTIANLIWRDKTICIKFREAITNLVNDDKPSVKLGSMYALHAMYSIDKEFSFRKIIDVLREDYRIMGYRKMSYLFFDMYDDSKEFIDDIILRCYKSDDTHLIKCGAYMLTKKFIIKNSFEEIIFDFENMSEIQVKAIIEMALVYFNEDEYNLKVKGLIEKYLASDLNFELLLSKLFYDSLVNLERDKSFIMEIMKSNPNKNILNSFIVYLEKSDENIIAYKDIIFTLSRNIIEQYIVSEKYSSTSEKLSKLILNLYDESSNNSSREIQKISNECLEIWDMMFEKRIGLARSLTQQMLDK